MVKNPKKSPARAARHLIARVTPLGVHSHDDSPAHRRILLVVTGGIAAYKTPELVRRLREKGLAVRCVLTKGGKQFVAPLALAAVSEDKVYEDLFSLTDESEMGHIRLSREADLVLVAPATADILAKMAAGLADDLAGTLLLATDKPVMAAPAMNVRMWDHPATRANLATLKKRGVRFVGPEEGDMACGEWGMGRMAEPDAIVQSVVAFLAQGKTAGGARGGGLAGMRALVTSGPTWEALDPVRYIANRSSGKQGHAITKALARRLRKGSRMASLTADISTGIETIAGLADQIAEAFGSAGQKLADVSGWNKEKSDLVRALADTLGDVRGEADALAAEAFVGGLRMDRICGEQDFIRPLLHQGRGLLVQAGRITVVGVGLGVGEALNLGVGDQNHAHAAVVAQRVEAGQDFAPVRQRKDVALAVPDVLDALDAALLANLGPDEAFQPVERIEDHSAVVVLLGVEFRQSSDDIGVLAGER